MNNILILRVVITLLFLLTWVFSPARGELAFRSAVDMKADDQVLSSDLLPDRPLITRRLMVPSQIAPEKTFVSTGFGLYPYDDDVPVVLTSVKIRSIIVRILKVEPDGTMNSQNNNGIVMTVLVHEVPERNSCIFTTGSRFSSVPNSPAIGVSKTTTIKDVGSIYLTKFNIRFGDKPYMPYLKSGEAYQVEATFDMEVVHDSSTRRIEIGPAQGLAARYVVSDIMPQITAIRPAKDGSPEIVTVLGEDARLFRMKWSPTLSAPITHWQLIIPPPTVTVGEGISHWSLPDMADSLTRFYVLEWTGIPQFYSP